MDMNLDMNMDMDLAKIYLDIDLLDMEDIYLEKIWISGYIKNCVAI